MFSEWQHSQSHNASSGLFPRNAAGTKQDPKLAGRNRPHAAIHAGPPYRVGQVGGALGAHSSCRAMRGCTTPPILITTPLRAREYAAVNAKILSSGNRIRVLPRGSGWGLLEKTARGTARDSEWMFAGEPASGVGKNRGPRGVAGPIWPSPGCRGGDRSSTHAERRQRRHDPRAAGQHAGRLPVRLPNFTSRPFAEPTGNEPDSDIQRELTSTG